MAPSATKPQAEEWGEEIGTGALVTWNEAKVVIGTIVALEEIPGGKYGDKFRATLVLDDGTKVNTFPPSMLLARLEQVPLNTRVRIEYDGTSTRSKAGRDVKNFSVRPSNKPSFEKLASGEVPF